MTLQCYFQCQKESRPSHETNLAFPMTEKNRAFAINCASVLGFQAIGGVMRQPQRVLVFS